MTLHLSSQQAHRSSWHFHSSHSCRTSQRIREPLGFICGQLLLRCQVTLVLNEDLVDTVGNMLVDLTHPSLHVVERFLVRDIADSIDVVCAVSVEHTVSFLLTSSVESSPACLLMSMSVVVHTVAAETWWALLLRKLRDVGLDTVALSSLLSVGATWRSSSQKSGCLDLGDLNVPS